MKSQLKINTEEAYNAALKEIDTLISKDFESSETKRKEFLKIALAIQSYEKSRYPLRMPACISNMHK